MSNYEQNLVKLFGNDYVDNLVPSEEELEQKYSIEDTKQKGKSLFTFIAFLNQGLFFLSEAKPFVYSSMSDGWDILLLDLVLVQFDNINIRKNILKIIKFFFMSSIMIFSNLIHSYNFIMKKKICILKSTWYFLQSI